MASLIPYLAHVAPAADAQQFQLLTAYRIALRHASATWRPTYMLAGFGVLCGIKGAPRCPIALADAVGIGMALRMRGSWGKLVAWARGALVEGLPEQTEDEMHQIRRDVVGHDDRLFWDANTARLGDSRPASARRPGLPSTQSTQTDGAGRRRRYGGGPRVMGVSG